MALYLARPRPLALAGWWGALLVIPLVLAGAGLTWPGSEIAGPLAISVGPAPAALEPSQPRVAVAAALASAGTITFDADRADLTGPGAATVQAIARVLGTGAGAKVGVGVVLTGYAADTPGPAAVAQRLSEQRASVVADALVSAGIDRSRIVVTGRGAADPLATPAASRRVEISLQ